MKNEEKIMELLLEYLKRLDKLEEQTQKERKEFCEKFEAQNREFRENFYFNQPNIAATQEDIRNENKVILALLKEGCHAERLAKT